MATPIDTGPERRDGSAWQIGPWHVDQQTNTLTRDSNVVRLEPKVIDLLVVLAERRGQVVTRQELFSLIWPDVVVGDEALNQTIIKLRRALGDNVRNPAYIETIPKRGYRLIAPVSRSGCARAAAATTVLPPVAFSGDRIATGRSPLRRASTPAALVLAVAAALVLGTGSIDQGHRVAYEPAAAQRRAVSPVAIAVGPFESLVPDTQHGYLARGIGDDLATDLARIPGVELIRGGGQSVTDARYRISGTVQRVADLLRVNVYVIDPTTGEQVWARRFEGPFANLLALQTNIVDSIVETLPADLRELARGQVAKRYTNSVEAYDSFLRGQALFLTRGSGENREARALYRKAVELDPAFARAYAGLAMTYAMDTRLGSATDRSIALARALELAETARQIDPQLPEVYWALGFVHAQNRRDREAIAALEQAMRLDASYADAYALLGGIHTYRGEPARSIPLLRTAMRLNPDAGYLYFMLLGRAYLFQGDIDQALINLRAAAQRNAADLETRIYLAAALAASGDQDAAKWETDEIRSLQPGFSSRQWLDTYPVSDARARRRLAALLAKAGV